MPNRVGERLDNYQLLRLLGTGSFGEVYLAQHVYRKGHVAVKVLPQLADNDLPAFLNEARTIRFKHPHIVQVLDFGVDHHVPFIVMDYAPHGTLRQRYPKGTQVPLDIIVTYTRQIVSALQYAHDEHIIHRDVKPENLLLGSHNEVLVSDFGIATMARSSRSQSPLEMAGTVAYMAPEQVQGKPRLASDQYALGIIVYEWLCGERPFNGSPMEIAVQHMLNVAPLLREKVPEIAPEVEQVVMKALAKDPMARFPNVQAFATALEQAYNLQRNRQQQPRTTMSNPIVIPPSTFPPIYQQQSPPEMSVSPAPPIAPNPPIAELAATFHPGVPMPSVPIASKVVPPAAHSSFSILKMGKATSVKTGKPGRRFYPTLALLAVAVSVLLLVALVGIGGYYFFLGPKANVDADLTQASMLISQAKAKADSNPTAALQGLAQAQTLLHEVQTGSLSDSQHQQLISLNSAFTSTAKTAIANYNQQGLITPLPCVNAPAAMINTGNTQTAVGNLAMLQDGKGATFSYALGDDHKLYQIDANHRLVNPYTPSNNAQVSAVAPDPQSTQRLLVLTTLPAQGTNAAASYSLVVLTVDQVSGGALKEGSVANIDSAFTRDGPVPRLMTAWGGDVYIVLTSVASPNLATILDYNVDDLKAAPQHSQISISTSLTSVAAFPNKQLFLLSSDGNVQSLQFSGTSNVLPGSVVVQSPIVTPLAMDTQNVALDTSIATPVVPASPAPQQSFLTVPAGGGNLMMAGSVNNTPHLYIVDVTNHRVLDLIEPAAKNVGGGVATVMVQLSQQYASPTMLALVKGVALDPTGTQLNLLTQTDQRSATLGIAQVNVTKNACTQAS